MPFPQEIFILIKLSPGQVFMQDQVCISSNVVYSFFNLKLPPVHLPVECPVSTSFTHDP